MRGGWGADINGIVKSLLGQRSAFKTNDIGGDGCLMNVLFTRELYCTPNENLRNSKLQRNQSICVLSFS